MTVAVRPVPPPGRSAEAASQPKRATPPSWQFAAGCFGAAHDRGAPPRRPLDLPPQVARGLAELLPILLCGEVSAELMFDDAALRLPEALDPALVRALRRTAADERRHGLWLQALRQALPAPGSRAPARRAASFLRALHTEDLALHLCRVAALDAATCVVLAAVCAHGAPLAGCLPVRDTFARIRRDEGRHVRLGRRCAAALGVSQTAIAGERRVVLAAFAGLLEQHAGSFAAIGVDPHRLVTRLDISGSSGARSRRQLER